MKKSMIFVTIILFTAISVLAYEGEFNSQGKIDNWGHFDSGIKFINQKDFRMAEQEFNFYLATSNAEVLRHMAGVAYFGRGLMFQAMGKTEKSIEEFKIAISRDWHPDFKITDKAWMNIGTIYIKKKNYKEAQNAYEKAVAFDPKNGQAQYYLGLAAVHAGNTELAEKQSSEAKKLGISYVGLDEQIAIKKNPVGASDRGTGNNKTSSKGKTRKAKSPAKEEQE